MFKQFDWQSLKSKLVVHAQEEDELVDPHDTLKEEAKEKHCKKLFEKLEECNKRVTTKTQTEETCTEEMFDYCECVDHYVVPKLFAKLK